MKSFRFKAWFSVTPQNIIIEPHRARLIGADNIAKIISKARKHKKNMVIKTLD